MSDTKVATLVAAVSPTAAGSKPILRRLGRVLKSAWRLWFFAGLIVLWWFLSANSTSTFFPPLKDIVHTFYKMWIVGDSAQTLRPSLGHFVVGYAISSVLGIAAGVLLWKLPRTVTAVSPLLYFIYVIPAAAILPAVAALMGYGMKMKVTIIVLAAVWPTLLNTLDGMRSIDPIRLDSAKVMHMSLLHTVRSVVIPNAMPQIMAGLRNSLQVAVIMMVVSELIASTSGIGFFILDAQQRFAITEMWTGVIVLALVGCVLTLLFVAVERVVLRWYLLARAVERKS